MPSWKFYSWYYWLSGLRASNYSERNKLFKKVHISVLRW